MQETVRSCSSPAGSALGRLCQLTASEIAKRVAAGEVSALEVVEAHISRIEAVNQKLNAVVVKRYDAARTEARAIDRQRANGEPLPPLAGVPVTIKECLDVKGTPSTFGLPSRAQAIAQTDEEHVARLRQAGAVVVGKTNAAQVLMFVETDNPLYGRTNNPWNLDRTSGGSSGGEGAIIAAYGSPLGLGTDVGGSCRYPANFCGIVGLKPTAGRCPDMGRFSLPIGQQSMPSQVGVLARAVDDVALGLGAINGTKQAGFEPPIPLGDLATVDIRKLRVGFYEEDGVLRSSPAVKRAVRAAVRCLTDAGAQVVEWNPPEMAQAMHLALVLMSADRGAHLKSILAGGPVHPSIKPMLSFAGHSPRTLALLRTILRAVGQRSLAEMTRHFGFSSADDYFRTTEAVIDFRSRFARAMDQAPAGPLDLIVGPACALPAFTHGAAKDIALAGANAVIYNVLGYPAGVVPVTRVRPNEETERPNSRDIVEKVAKRCEVGSANLPVGVQIAARPWREHVALAAMRVVERQSSQQPDYPKLPF